MTKSTNLPEFTFESLQDGTALANRKNYVAASNPAYLSEIVVELGALGVGISSAGTLTTAQSTAIQGLVSLIIDDLEDTSKYKIYAYNQLANDFDLIGSLDPADLPVSLTVNGTAVTNVVEALTEINNNLGASGAVSLNGLSDVNVPTTPTDGQILRYDGITDNAFEAVDNGANFVTITDTSNNFTTDTVQFAVNELGTLIGGDGLSGVVGVSTSLNKINGVNVTSGTLTSGNVLQYDGTSFVNADITFTNTPIVATGGTGVTFTASGTDNHTLDVTLDSAGVATVIAGNSTAVDSIANALSAANVDTILGLGQIGDLANVNEPGSPADATDYVLTYASGTSQYTLSPFTSTTPDAATTTFSVIPDTTLKDATNVQQALNDIVTKAKTFAPATGALGVNASPDATTPTVTEVQTYVTTVEGLSDTNLRDSFLTFTGTNTSTDPITYLYYVDGTGSVLELVTPTIASVDSLTIGGGSTLTGAVSIPVSSSGVEGVIDLDNVQSGTLLGSYAASPGAVVSTDTINNALQKLDGNVQANTTSISNIPDEVIENNSALSGVVPTGAQVGVDTSTGALYYNNSGNWAAVPVSTVDLNTTVSNQTGGNYGGAAAVSAPAGPDAGDLHIEIYDDVTAYFTATGAGFPNPADFTINRNITPLVLNDLSDVNTAGVVNGDLLEYNGTSFVAKQTNYSWNGTAYVTTNNGVSNFYEGSDDPTNTVTVYAGDRWHDTTNNIIRTYVDNGGNPTWIS